MKQLTIVLALFSFTFSLLFPDATDDLTTDSQKTVAYKEQVLEALKYGIDSEVVALFQELGRSPGDDILRLIVERYDSVKLSVAKIEYINYFSNIKTPPAYLIDTLYNEATDDYIDKQTRLSIINAFAKIGGLREGKYLLENIDNPDKMIADAAAQALVQMKIRDLAGDILDKLAKSDEDSDYFLNIDVKNKLILALGEMGATEAIPYLREIISTSSNDKYSIMYGMVSLAKLKDVESLDSLYNNLGHAEVKVQEYASYSIGLFEGAEVLPYLNKMLLHNNEKVRVEACKGLALNKDKSAIPVLSYKFRKDPSSKTRSEAISSLFVMEAEGIAEIKKIYEKQKITPDILNILCDVAAKKPDAYNVEYIKELFINGDKKNKEIIAKRIIYTTSNLLDDVIRLLLVSDDYLFRLGGLKAVSTIENCALWDVVSDMAQNDKAETVKRYAAKILSLKS
ncbi:MAG TPA: HEAT repeat domain-containing protein [Spirochaetota bacterium]|nr:HEAT repeat domain-containing protein [Spirochaetota bacterium]HOS33276.1 HEAT repeat domain-containing protein [Spirochaetota bacterium]HOS56580.1 HEAT repeat domain-containing protein [Spirochaetota bacterium]HPK62432.1 HEAT repeat domain-containing protein [Spirochaetota bacterium]HQF78842.1 HEAT repeat domain-containing protein [Spirochaetota bacterium]